MNHQGLPAPLRGVIAPLITPLRDSDDLDVGGLERLLEYVVAGGVHRVFVLGVTGEGPSLSHRPQREVVEADCRHLAGRLPVLVGITDASARESNLLGLKDRSSGATCFFSVRDAVARERPEFSLLIGPEQLMVQGLRAGARRAIDASHGYHYRLERAALFAALRRSAHRSAD